MSFPLIPHNIGPKIAEKLDESGIHTLAELKKIGAEEAFFRYFQSQGGWKSGMCSCLLYTFEGAITHTKWNKIPPKRKEELKKYVHDLRKSFKSK
jgi:hypothetical protein